MMNFRISSPEQYEVAYRRSVEDPEGFWDQIAKEYHWFEPWHKTLEWEFYTPSVKWFIGGKTNITYNCLDRHLKKRGNKLALIWEPNDPKEKFVRLTYRELYERVCQYANVLKRNGIKKGDRVAIYMPMIPELAIAVLACARIGAVHSVVFAGFSAVSLADRIKDAGAVAVLTSDGLNRGTKQIPVKRVVDEAISMGCDTVKKVIVTERLGWAVNMVDGRDVWLHDELKHVTKECPAEPMDSEDLLFILYTSGSTGKPKGVVHTVGGYMVYTGYTFLNVFQYEESDVFWCTADVGWITGHSYLIYGPLLNGATTLMFEGIPTYPDAGRFWQVVDKYGVNIFYTAPTAIRSLMAAGIDHVLSYSLDSLKVLGTVGEPINEEAWNWYYIHVGKERCPIVDTWWQTETGGILISALAGISKLKPAHAGLPLPGTQPVLLDQDGNEIPGNDVEGYLCIRHPWPSMIRTTYGDHDRCRQTYFSAFKGYYFTGDGARRDTEGLYRIIGRVDDVINVSGHRFGTAEIENAINLCKKVVESAVVGYPHDIKGQGIYAFVVTAEPVINPDLIQAEIIESVVAAIGKIARPDKIQFVSGLPKTRSGKIMRRILRKVAEGDVSNLGDTTTLLDPAVVDEIIEGARLVKVAQ
ncbi:acetate--CoA ligase [Schleiferia thermophila]|jgi:acetyl-CoA synthetase|uniref:Acetate--CoA ligase n=1 Tax=Schleiferia thermophila TaxID=884107 RepID=A0A368ZZ18_9FLAO|nr:acetate--CoA ligase [Schleiferia thermophila]PMB35304.1 acetyl-coenzyme A synthetase [Fischerella thermalis CCMEE 5319]RCX02262.1 acetyl-coenzyme A synthetase [Schleiferia thermophila]GCD80853.1 acetyl-coenzyme A synthetase [Schleiferia thermophila]